MTAPLSEQLRPKKFSDIVGQEHLLGKHGFITSIIKSKRPVSLILWGPPGSGKTSITRLYAESFPMPFESLSAVFTGVADLKKILSSYESVLLFIDEIHRFNKAQQDAFLPFLENGKLILIGATVENPSFYLNKALLSRVRVLRVNSLSNESLEKIVDRYEKYRGISFSKEIRQYLIDLSHGDGRYLLNLLENLEGSEKKPKTIDELQNFLQEKAPLFDRDTDQHYNLISALHKSLRGSDPDAALYWLSRMLIGGEDPLYIARRLIRVASEDIGLADPQALALAISARDAYEMLGSPEGELAIAELVVYLALAPKSNSIYTAFSDAQKLAMETNHLPPPSIILNAPTPLLKKMGHGKGYIYDHDTPSGFSGQNYFPEDMKRINFYHPQARGFEREMEKRIQYFSELRKKNKEV